MKEKLVDQLKQQDRIEYKLDRLGMEDVFNFLTYLKWFMVIVCFVMINLLVSIKRYSDISNVVIVIVSIFVIFDLLSWIFRIVKSIKINEKYLETKIRRK